MLAYLDTLDGPLLVGWSLLGLMVSVAIFATAAAWDRRPSTESHSNRAHRIDAEATRAVSSARKSRRRAA